MLTESELITAQADADIAQQQQQEHNLKQQQAKQGEYIPIEPVHFAVEGTVYRYEFSTLTLRQVMLAETLAMWQVEQLSREELTWNEMQRMGADEYLIKIGALLLRRVVGDALDGFTKMAIPQIENHIADFSVEQMTRLEECVTDFFIRRNKRQVGLETLQRQSAKRKLLSRSIQAAQPSLMTLLGALANSNNSPIQTKSGNAKSNRKRQK